mmetsp:Transcript_5114/g.7084  ORF Transcript_5114/g.7084 Transcript_5114/m.7084 type:complete len:80 (+) Transcript_5114:91-330(+)
MSFVHPKERWEWTDRSLLRTSPLREARANQDPIQSRRRGREFRYFCKHCDAASPPAFLDYCALKNHYRIFHNTSAVPPP